MNDFDIPIFKKSYELYKALYEYLKSFPRQDRYSLGVKCESVILEMLEDIILASQSSKAEKLPILQKASVKLNLLRIYVRLAKEVRALDSKKYLFLQEDIDEIGRMLGGWLRSAQDKN